VIAKLVSGLFCRSGLSHKAIMNAVSMQRPMEAAESLRMRILLVEDERLVRESIGMLLSRDEHTVVEANNGAEALSLFTRGHFDLVLTDFELPFMKGNELAVRIKQLAPCQPILMITGHAKRSGPENPVDAVLNKPVNLDQLREAMAELFSEVGECVAA
jgi:CheY-like chemotaxis protein